MLGPEVSFRPFWIFSWVKKHFWLAYDSLYLQLVLCSPLCIFFYLFSPSLALHCNIWLSVWKKQALTPADTITLTWSRCRKVNCICEVFWKTKTDTASWHLPHILSLVSGPNTPAFLHCPWRNVFFFLSKNFQNLRISTFQTSMFIFSCAVSKSVLVKVIFKGYPGIRSLLKTMG